MNWTTLFKKFTNGKYIVGLLAVAFLSIGSFTSATEITFNGDGSNYNPNSFTSVEEFNLLNSVTDYSCTSDVCSFKIFNGEGKGAVLRFSDDFLDCIDYEMNCNKIPADSYEIDDYGDGSFNYITLNIPNGNDNLGGNIVQGGTSNFTPIITKLSNIAGEFIPYMLYIAIACLGVTLAFKALRYIIGYLQNKSKGAIRGK